MPSKYENIKLQGLQDRRRKLTDEQKEEMKNLYETGNWSLRLIGIKFGVSKSAAALVCNPARAEAMRQYQKENWRDRKKSNEENAEAVRRSRQYKQTLYKQGMLKEWSLENSSEY
jgi:hypothetical protein